MLSIIVPALDEEENLADTLQPLQAMRRAGLVEILVVDGGSGDDTPALAADLADTVLLCLPGRSRQMNMGAAHARGDTLLFLHADTRPPAGESWLTPVAGASWGFFDVRLSHPGLPYRIIGAMMNLRSRVSGIGTGDQALFVKRSLFEETGGFPPIRLMEDVAYCKTLKAVAGRPVDPGACVFTSSRRWQERGLVRTILLMWSLRLAYFLGVPGDRLARLYR